MTKSATDLMQDIVFSAVIDSVMALKAASKGLPNTLLRDLNAVHANTTFADLPQEVQASIAASVRAAFTRLLKEGYSVSPAGASSPRTAQPRDGGRGPRDPGRGPATGRRDGGEGRRPPREGRERTGAAPTPRGGRPPRGNGRPGGSGGGRPGGGRPGGGKPGGRRPGGA